MLKDSVRFIYYRERAQIIYIGNVLCEVCEWMCVGGNAHIDEIKMNYYTHTYILLVGSDRQSAYNNFEISKWLSANAFVCLFLGKWLELICGDEQHG